MTIAKYISSNNARAVYREFLEADASHINADIDYYINYLAEMIIELKEKVTDLEKDLTAFKEGRFLK